MTRQQNLNATSIEGSTVRNKRSIDIDYPYELHLTMLEPIRVVRRSDWDGPAERVFALARQHLSSAVADMRTVTQDVARFIDDTATTVQYMKILVLEQLVILAGQIAHLLATSYSTFGASVPAAGELAALASCSR